MTPWLLALVLVCAPADDAYADIRSPDPEKVVAAIEALRKMPGAEVSRSIAKTLRRRNPAIRKAALDALAERADEDSVNALRKALVLLAKDADTLPVVVTALGSVGDARSASAIVKLARQSLGRDPRLAEASIDALGSLRSSESVSGLVELLATAEPVRGGAGARGGHSRYVRGIRESLREVTGLPYRETATWTSWWRHARRRWQPTPLDPSAEEGATRRDDAWRFRISRPDTSRWAFQRAQGAALRILYRGPREEAVVAWLDVLAHATGEREPKTLTGAAKAAETRMRSELRDVREIVTGQRMRLGTVDAVRHRAVGLLAGGRVIVWRMFFLERHGLLYTVSVHVASGASERVMDEVDEMLASFRLLDA